MELGLRFSVDYEGRTIWIVDAHRDGKRFVVRADEKLTAFGDIESAIRGLPLEIPAEWADQATPYMKIRRCPTRRSPKAALWFKCRGSHRSGKPYRSYGKGKEKPTACATTG